VLGAVARAAAAGPAGKPMPTRTRARTNLRRAAHPREHARASARASPHRISGYPTHAASRAPELSPPAPATPATPLVALSLASAGPNPAKGRPFSCLLVCFVNPSLAKGHVARQLLTLAAGETSTGRRPFGDYRRTPVGLLPRPRGVFPSHVGPHAMEAAADHWDPMRLANPVLWHTSDLTEPSRRESCRDPVWLTTPAAKWAAAGLKATDVAAPSALVAGLQPASS
jgi:hypothetical protein